ncbi:hypothetical protein BGX26_010242 [Mortierella sp. AD094]|nr:hypothetical protein BGX26_010242 [Mortierella sp. AD094]
MSPSSMQTLRPSKIRKLTLLHVSNLSTLDQLQLIKLCPELESLNWDLLSRAEAWIEFATATAAGTWPNLESLNLAYEGSADYDALSKVLGSLRKLTELRVHGIGMGPTFYQALRRYFSTIQVLYLARTDVCSSMVQEVLTHCTSLTSFTAYKIRGEDVVEGQPWGCLQLKELRLYFDLDPTHQRRVYEQLARLTQLRSLRDGICHDNDLNDDLRISLDFRLKSGLELLSGLKRLKHLTIERECGSKAIAEDDVRWMVKHWTSLETVDGDRMERFRRKHAASIQYSMEWYGTEGYSLLSPMNNDDKINKELRYIFSSHGVTLR